MSGINQISFPFIQSNIDSHSFYALPIVLDENINRQEFCRNMEKNGIETRAIMSGNLSRQPGFKDRVEKRVGLENADRIMRSGFFIGCHPLITDPEIDHICNTMKAFLS